MIVKLLDLAAQYRPLREEVRNAIEKVCDEQSLILGPHVETFERQLADYCGTTHAIGVSSGSDALLCALMGIGIGPGDEVIVPSFTFFATAGSVARLGAKPVFADIDPRSFNLDPARLEERITSRTRAILPVHLYGQLADMEAINQVAQRHGVTVMEDAAQAIGARRHGKAACAQSFAGCLSFYPTKNLGAFGDAGAICTSNGDFAERCRKLRVHGSGHTYHHEMIGGMFRMAAIQAAVLSVKLKYLPGWHEGRRRNAALYDRLLSGSRVVAPATDPGNYAIYHQYVVRIPERPGKPTRDQVKQALSDAGIGSGVYYPIPLHLQKCFEYLGGREGDLPQSEQASREVLALPIYPELTEEQVRYVAQALLDAVG